MRAAPSSTTSATRHDDAEARGGAWTIPSIELCRDSFGEASRHSNWAGKPGLERAPLSYLSERGTVPRPSRAVGTGRVAALTEPDLAVSVTGRGRMYRHPVTEDLYPSITNIIDVLAKPWLAGWAAKLVAGEAWDQRFALTRLNEREQAVDMLKGAPYRKRDKAAKVGDVVHNVAEALATGDPLPEFEEIHQPYIDTFMRFVDEFDPSFTLLEGTVFNDTHLYAGTFDFLAVIEQLLILGDYKSGSGIYDEVALQLSAARNAEYVWDKQTGVLSPMPVIDGCVAVHLRPGKLAVHTIDAGMEAFYAFLGLRAAWPWNKDHTGAVGPRMNRVRLVREFSSGAGPAREAGAAVASPPLPAPVEDSPAADETTGEGHQGGRLRPDTPAPLPSPAGDLPDDTGGGSEVFRGPVEPSPGDQAVLGG